MNMGEEFNIFKTLLSDVDSSEGKTEENDILFSQQKKLQQRQKV